MRRILTVLAVAALMTSMMVAMAMPAFAASSSYECTSPIVDQFGLTKQQAREFLEIRPDGECIRTSDKADKEKKDKKLH